MSKRLVLTFRNAAGKTITLSLADPRADVTALEVTTAMDTIVARNVFTSSGGDLVSKERAAIIDTTENELYTTG